MSCCQNPNIVKGVCESCFSLIPDIEFECFDVNVPVKQLREKKFFDYIYSQPIPNMVKTTLIDVFPRIITEFYKTDRTNFINLPHLVRELLPLIGYPEYVNLFPSLKTPSKQKEIKKIVSGIFREGGSSYEIKRLEDLEYLMPVVPDILDTRPVKDHTFSDRISIMAKDNKPKPKPKAKPAPKPKPKAKRSGSCCESCKNGGTCENKGRYKIDKLIKKI